jgi:hypothetical protein
MLLFFGLLAAVGLGFGIVGLVNQASYGYPLFYMGLGFFVAFVILSALTGKSDSSS